MTEQLYLNLLPAVPCSCWQILIMPRSSFQKIHILWIICNRREEWQVPWHLLVICGLSACWARARERAPAHCACCRLSLVNLRLLVGTDSRDPYLCSAKISWSCLWINHCIISHFIYVWCSHIIIYLWICFCHYYFLIHMKELPCIKTHIKYLKT